MKRKISVALLCFALVGLLLGGYAIHDAVRAKKTRPVAAGALGIVNATEPIYYTAHRGFSADAPENSLAAFRRAAEAGYYACEFDIRPAKDGTFMVMHDETIDRTTNGKGKLADFTREELQAFKIDTGSKLNQYETQRIPTLEETLDLLAAYSIRPMIEIKGGTEQDIARLWGILTARGITKNVTIISFNLAYLEQLRALSADTTLWWLVSEIKEDTIPKARSLGSIGIAFNGNSKKNLPYIESIFASDLTAAAWTIDNPDVLKTLHALGVRYFTTNRITP